MNSDRPTAKHSNPTRDERPHGELLPGTGRQRGADRRAPDGGRVLAVSAGRLARRIGTNPVSGGVLLLAATVVALIWANLPGNSYYQFWSTDLTIGTRRFGLTESLRHWVSDGLMAVFFLAIGVEIKRELIYGELSDFRRATLPFVGAIGGMVLPALLFVLFAAGTTAMPGWGIPIATDIAFALGILAMLGRRVPPSLKLFLVALAIVDDVGAVLVIAVFYVSSINASALLAAGALYLLLVAMNRGGFTWLALYVAVGAALWVAVLASGVHATIAGVLLASVIPSTPGLERRAFLLRSERALAEFLEAGGARGEVMSSKERREAVTALENAARSAQSPLLRLEHKLAGVVAFAIMPLFALANAGVAPSVNVATLFREPVVIGIVAGLVVGKPLGIAGAAWIAVRAGYAELPKNASWLQLVGVAAFGGVGFTMSLFIAGLAFTDDTLLDMSRIGILVASLLSGVIGWTLIARASRVATAHTVASEPDASSP